jgi:anti-sigma-K factor RskA
VSEALPPRPHASTEPGAQPELPARPPGSRAARSGGGIFNLPLWLRTTFSLGIAAVLLTALVLYVSHHNTNSPPITNLAAEARANREAEILVSQDQAPHVARLSPGAAPAATIERAVRAFMANQIARGAISGPLQHEACDQVGKRAGVRRAFSCVIQAGGVGYQFRGVVDARARRITYCKHDPPAIPSQNVPLSRRCLA